MTPSIVVGVAIVGLALWLSHLCRNMDATDEPGAPLSNTELDALADDLHL